MKSVLGFVKHNRLRSLQNFSTYFLATMSRKTMHYHAILFCLLKKFRIDLISSEIFATPVRFRLPSHACPDVGVEHICAGGCIRGILHDRDLAYSGLFCPAHDFGPGMVSSRRSKGKIHWKDRRCLKPRMDHIVAVADEDRKSTRLNSSHGYISYAVFCLKKI